MVHIVIGVAAVVAGVWWISTDFVIFCEILKTLVYLGLIGFGIVAALAGIRQFRSAK
jgi:hypothetical protein